MKLPEKPSFNTIGLNSFSVHSALIVAGVIFAGLNPWWLCLAAPLFYLGVGTELHQKKPTISL